MLVVVKNRNGHDLLEPGFDVEAFRGLDVLEVDAAKSGLEHGNRFDDLIRIGGGEFNIEYIDVGEAFEEDRFSLHDRFGGQRPNMAQTQHRRTVGHHGNEVSFGCIVKNPVRIPIDFPARFGNPRGVGHGEVPLGDTGLR